MSGKVIYLTHARIPSEKTPSPFILKTCEGLVREGYEVELWAADRHNVPDTDPFEYHGIETRFPIRRIRCIDMIGFTGRLGFPVMVLSYNISVWFSLLGRNNVIIYAHDARDVLLPSLLRRPLFLEVHDFYISSIGFINRLVMPRVTGWIVTNRIKRDRLARAGVPEDRLLVQPNAVDVDMFAIPVSKDAARRTLGLPFGRRIVMYTGHLYAWKGVYTIAEAVRHLPEDTLMYFVGGTKRDRHAFESFIHKEKLPRISLVPHQEHATIPLFQKAADVLLLPNTAKEDVSKYETSPVKLFEYLASGTPIVASDLPSIREIVSEREVCFARPDDAEDFARAIAECAKDPVGAQKRADAAENLARTHSWEVRAKNIGAFLRRSDSTA